MNTFTKNELKKLLEAINFIKDGDPTTTDCYMKLTKMIKSTV